VKGFGCRRRRDLSPRAEGRRPKAPREGTRGGRHGRWPSAIKAAGGTTMVLTPHRSGGRGMPDNAMNYDGPIDKIGTPEQIAEEIGRLLAQ
jgi:hypothetical protein